MSAETSHLAADVEKPVLKHSWRHLRDVYAALVDDGRGAVVSASNKGIGVKCVVSMPRGRGIYDTLDFGARR